jgi:transcriptional regulator with XRE-family HTH domain
MKKWTAGQIKALRLKLGWTTSQLSRFMGCEMSLIKAWERNHSQPDVSELHQLDRLQQYCEEACWQTQQRSLADSVLNDLNVDQLHHAEIEDILPEE